MQKLVLFGGTKGEWRYPPQLPSFLFPKVLHKECSCCEGSFILTNRERDILHRTILELLMKGGVHYTDLDKKMCATCHSFVTTNTFKSQLQYLLNNNYTVRVARGIYQITLKGKKYLALLES